MNLSYRKLQSFLSLGDFSIEEVVDQITLKTCEVEFIRKPYQFLENVVVSHVTKIIQHPNANRLSIIEIDIASEQLQIVTGASNVQVGKKYPLAKIGATLPNGISIKSSTLRGVSSQGMLCSSQELDLSDFLLFKKLSICLKEDGLLTLPDEFHTGASLLDILCLEDTVIVIDNKSITHRPDLWGHYGFARELSSILDVNKLINPYQGLDKTIFNDQLDRLQIHVDKNIASAYSLTKISGIQIEASSYEIQSYLLHLGLRPINNIVDISNVILYDIGQPNHFFDANKVELPISIKFSEAQNNVFIGLNNKKIKLQKTTAVIEDTEQQIAIAGVIGGQLSEVTEDTNSVYFESAHFYRSIIRETVSRLGVRTDSSQRFEKGLDPSNIKFSLEYLSILLKRICPNIVFKAHAYIEHEDILENKINTSYSYIKQRLGDVGVTSKSIKDILERFHMKVKVDTKNNDHILVTVPSFRSYYDIEIQEDLVEEVGRFIGYENITAHPLLSLSRIPTLEKPDINIEKNVRIIASIALGYTEVYNYSFITDLQSKLDISYSSSPIALKNPINQEFSYLRNSLFPSLLKNIQDNYRKSTIVRFYELERIFVPSTITDTKVEEKKTLAFIAYEDIKKTKVTELLKEFVYDLIKFLEKNFLDRSYIKIERSIDTKKLLHPSRSGSIYYILNDKKIHLFRFGQIHPKICAEHKIPNSIIYADLLLENLKLAFTRGLVKYRPLIKFPSSYFEFTLLVDKFEDLSSVLKKIYLDKKVDFTKEKILQDKIFIQNVQLLSSYEGSSIDNSKKAISLRITWINPTRTIQSEELKTLRNKLISLSEKKGYLLK